MKGMQVRPLNHVPDWSHYVPDWSHFSVIETLSSWKWKSSQLQAYYALIWKGRRGARRTPLQSDGPARAAPQAPEGANFLPVPWHAVAFGNPCWLVVYDCLKHVEFVTYPGWWSQLANICWGWVEATNNQGFGSLTFHHLGLKPLVPETPLTKPCEMGISKKPRRVWKNMRTQRTYPTVIQHFWKIAYL